MKTATTMDLSHSFIHLLVPLVKLCMPTTSHYANCGRYDAPQDKQPFRLCRQHMHCNSIFCCFRKQSISKWVKLYYVPIALPSKYSFCLPLRGEHSFCIEVLAFHVSIYVVWLLGDRIGHMTQPLCYQHILISYDWFMSEVCPKSF